MFSSECKNYADGSVPQNVSPFCLFLICHFTPAMLSVRILVRDLLWALFFSSHQRCQ